MSIAIAIPIVKFYLNRPQYNVIDTYIFYLFPDENSSKSIIPNQEKKRDATYFDPTLTAIKIA